jgi:chromosome partitioning protein
MNQKGGVGKTTTTLNLAHALALDGHRVLAMDMDPQGQLTAGLGVVNDQVPGLDTVLIDGKPVRDVVVTVRENLNLVPAGPRLAEFEYVQEGGAVRGWRLQKAIESLSGMADIVLIDAPPSAGLLSMNSLIAAGEVLLPVTGEYLALHGVSRFMQVLDHVDGFLNRDTRVWIALTRFNDRRRLAREVRARLIEHFPGSVLVTPVRESVSLAESPACGQSIFDYDRNGRGAEDYRALSHDLLTARTL